MSTRISDLPLRELSVPVSATFIDAARTLATSGAAAIAIVDGERRVVGLFTDDDFLRGVFPGYVDELRHTAFVREDAAFKARLERGAGEPVARHMREPVTVELASSALHVAERFLHCPWGAIAVVKQGRFVGILRQVDFVEGLLRSA